MNGASSAMSEASAVMDAAPTPVEGAVAPENMGMREARLTVLRAVAEGRVAPEEAERLLFG